SLMGYLLRRRDKIQQKLTLFSTSRILILVFAIVTLLHLLETSIWAGFYYSRYLFADFETSLYFSLKTYTTIGYGDILLPRGWRLIGGVEGLSGVLLCGVSTAF